METYLVLFWGNINFSKTIMDRLFSDSFSCSGDLIPNEHDLYRKPDIIIVDFDCIKSDEQRIFLASLELKEKVPVLYFGSPEKLSHLKSWQKICSDYSEREILLSLEVATYKREIDKELDEVSYQNESSKLKIENQAAVMALMVEKMAVLQNQEQRFSSAKSRYIKQIMFQLATEINNVLGFIQLIKDKGEYSDNLYQIHFASESLLYQMQNVLTMSSYESNELGFTSTEFDFKAIFDSIIELFKPGYKKQNIQVDFDCSIEDGFWDGPQDAFQILFFNLFSFIGHCCKVTDNVKISVNHTKSNEKNKLSFMLSIPIANLPTQVEKSLKRKPEPTKETPFDVFERDETLLYVSSLIINSMGGKLVHNFENGVLTFRFDMPFRFKAGSDTFINNKYKLSVLFVDDNEMSRRLGLGIMNNFKCDAVTVENGSKALEILNKQKFDLVFMDCHMPIMDGFETTLKLRAGEAGELNRNVTVIALTAKVLRSDREKCTVSGMNDFLAKPIRKENVKSILQKWKFNHPKE